MKTLSPYFFSINIKIKQNLKKIKGKKKATQGLGWCGQALLSSNIFHTNFAILFKTSDCHKISSFNDWGLKFGYFDILDMLFPLLAFVKL